MTQETMPFFESAEAATKHAMLASGKSPKDVGHALWPDKSPDSARTALLNALNEHRNERLTADQHIFIANYCERFDWLYYAALQCRHTRPERVTPEALSSQFQAALFEKTDELRGLLAQIDALKQQMAI